MRFAAVLAACTVLLTGCSDLFSHGYPYATFEARVTLPSGAPAAGISVVLYSFDRDLGSGTTDANGSIVFTQVPEGSYGLRVFPPRHVLVQGGQQLAIGEYFVDGFSVGRGEHHVQQVTLVAAPCCGTIRVRSVDRAGHPLAQVPLKLTSTVGDEGTRATDASGNAVFGSLPQDTYDVRATALPAGYIPPPGYGAFAQGIRVRPGLDTTLTFLLTNECCGTVRVRVVDTSGAPLGNVHLTLYSVGGTVATGTTDAGGVHVFQAPVGSLGVLADAPAGYAVPAGAKPYVDAIDVDLGTDRTVTITFQKQ